MKQERFVEKVILSIGLILLFSSSSTRYIEEFKYLTEYLFRFGGLFIVIAMLSSLIKRKTLMNNTLKRFTYLYGGFISLIILSIIVNQNLETEIGAFERFVLIFLFLGVFLSLTDVVSEGLIINALMISSTIIFTYFLIEYPISEMTRPGYQGGFSNPNAIGVLAVTFFSVSFIAGTSLLKLKRNYLLVTLYFLIALGAAYLTVISGSRTSFITLVIIFGITSLTFTYDVLKSRHLLSWKSVSLIFLLALGGISLFIFIDNPVYTAIESSIFDKFTMNMERGSITDGRIPIWTTIIEGAGFFGKGSGYFKEISGLSAHNSFLHMVSIYGWLAAIAYVVFWLVMLVKSIHYYLVEKSINRYALLPLILIINYLSLSMMENMSIHLSVFLATSMIAILSKPKEISFTI